MSRTKLLGFVGRHCRVMLVVAVLSVAAPGFAQQPFGALGGIAGGDESGSGVLPLHGWCLDDSGIAAVDIFVDGELVGRAAYGRQRPDVNRAFPAVTNSLFSGFAFQLNSARFLNGNHFVQPRCTSRSGEVIFVRGKELGFNNNTHLLVPFGRIDFPNRNAQLFGNCDVTDPQRRYSVVEGWALDVGVEIGDEGIGYVELLIDGSIFANTRRDCFFDRDTGGLTNCQGLIRTDIEQSFPGLKDSPNSGFRFAMDIGALIDFGFVRGFHVLTIRAGDIAGQFANIDEIPVIFNCDEDVANEGAFGRIGRPLDGSKHTGLLDVVGWALDFEGIREVEIWVDGERVGLATLGLERVGVSARYPGFPDSLTPGFAFRLDTRVYENGPHQLQVFTQDNAAPRGRSLIGERTFFIDN